MQRSRFMTRAAVLAGVALLIAGCGGGEATTKGGAGPAASKNFTIAMIAKSSTNPVFLSGRAGADSAAKELSKQHGVNVRVDWLTPPSEDATIQAQRIAGAVNSGDNAFLLSASDAGKVVGAVDEAVDRASR